MSFDLHHSNESGYDDTNDSNILVVWLNTNKVSSSDDQIKYIIEFRKRNEKTGFLGENFSKN
ncbi:hypothetical protein DERP_008110 [Dermatophagoides pteronyssinus]|uniref:Uncharacterized protein n=1 Tax=Dermatophagoides pteronyssinus TaxID=6956 RepID=A0ABQ8JK78_DERPT|nr:hypothetical protein DERP_008110 [Dermatophagoides pteronyssinus]